MTPLGPRQEKKTKLNEKNHDKQELISFAQ